MLRGVRAKPRALVAVKKCGVYRDMSLVLESVLAITQDWPRSMQTISSGFVQGTRTGLEEGRILISAAWIHQADLLLPVSSMLTGLFPHLTAMVTRQTRDPVKLYSSVSAMSSQPGQRSQDNSSISKANIIEFMVKFNLLMCPVIPRRYCRLSS